MPRQISKRRAGRLAWLPPQHRQEVLDELQARSQSGTVRNVVAYFFALVKRVLRASSVCGQDARRRLPRTGLIRRAPKPARNRLRHRHRVKPPWRTSPTSARC